MSDGLFAIAVTTAPRPEPTLERSIDSLGAARCDLIPWVVADRAPLAGLVATWARGLRHLLDETSAAVLVMAQDDVTWPAEGWMTLRQEMASLLAAHPDAGYGSFYTSGRVRSALHAFHGENLVDGWWPTGDLPIRHSGAQCYAVPRAAAQDLLRDPVFIRLTETAYKGLDVLVTAALNRIGHPTWTRLPSLIDHHILGGNGNTSKRQSRWRGPRCAS